MLKFTVTAYDAGEPGMFGGEIPPQYGVRVKLLLRNPWTKETVVISEDRTTL